MLTPEQWEQIEKQATGLYEQLELEIIEEIATRISSVGYANTVALNDIEIAQQMGMLYQDVIDKVAKYNNTSAEKIAKIFKLCGAISIAFDDKIYKEAGLKPTPFLKDKSLLQVLDSIKH